MVEWIPVLGLRPAPGKKGLLRDLENAYLEDPTDGSFINLLMAYNNTTEPVVVANPTLCGDMNNCPASVGKMKTSGNLDGIERQRMMALLILTHEMRREMLGEESRTSAEMADVYPLNPFGNWGALAESSAMACDAVRASLHSWQNTDDVKRECARIPAPWNGEYTDCMNGGGCCVSPDLLAMGLPLRWLGFMVQPALTANQVDHNDPEPSSLVKVATLGSALEAAGLSSHHALMFVTHRMVKFFGPDQGWRSASPFTTQQTLVQEFTQMNAIGTPNGAAADHGEVHAMMVKNIESMLNLLASEVTL